MGEFELVEVYEKPNGHIEQLHVRKELGFVNRKNAFDALGLDQDAVLDRRSKRSGSSRVKPL